MKLPYIDIHIVKGRNVMTDAELIELTDGLKEQDDKNKLRNKVAANLLHENLQLKDILKQK